MFKVASKPMSSVSVAWDESAKGIQEGKARYYGERIVGKFIEKGFYEDNESNTYSIKLYSDFEDESKFGQEPDGDVVTVWGNKMIDDAFEYGTEGAGIQPGDIVEIVYLGMERTKDGKRTYKNFQVGSMTPSPKFSTAAPKAAPVGAVGAVGTAPAPKPAPKAAPARVTQAPPVAAKPTQSAAEDALDDLGY